MKILMAHTQYQQRGGEDESAHMEASMLEANGHEVVRLTEHNDRLNGQNRIVVAANTVWSLDSFRRIRSLIRDHRPDVLHVQNFFPLLSPSIHHAALAAGLPVVQSLRNYPLLCPGALLFRDGSPCEACIGTKLQLPAVRHACYRESRMASAVVASMNAAHRWMGTWRSKNVSFIALSDFVKRKFVEAGWSEEKIAVKPNFVFPDPGVGEGRGSYAIFAGRLSPEKGLSTLLEAWRSIGSSLPLRIVGDGPMAGQVRQAASSMEGVEWLGRLSLSDLYSLIGDARAVVVPSESYETFGRVVIEAFAKGTPAIVSDIGSLGELVTDHVTGYRFRAGDPGDLVAAVRRLLSHPDSGRSMRAAPRREFLAKYAAEANLRQLIAIYERAIQRRAAA